MPRLAPAAVRPLAAAIAACIALSGIAPAATAQAARRGPAGPDLTKATEGYFYYNRPGATLDQHNVELADCIRAAKGSAPEGVYFTTAIAMSSQGLAGVGLGVATAATIVNAYEQVKIEHCMVGRGWRVIVFDEGKGGRYRRMKLEELNAALGEMVGAPDPAPNSRVVRSFRNEAALGGSLKYGIPDQVEQTNISERALKGGVAVSTDPVLMGPDLTYIEPTIVPVTDLAQARRDGMAVVVIRVTGDRKKHGGHALAFERSGGDPAKPDTFRAVLPDEGDARAERTIAFAVPAGQWRLARFYDPKPSIFAHRVWGSFDFCLGAPAFEAKAGEVIYLGSFDLTGQLGPDMAMDPARAFLAPQADLAAEVKPAAWVNGVRGLCRGQIYYALAFPGAPYAEGYAGARLAAAD